MSPQDPELEQENPPAEEPPRLTGGLPRFPSSSRPRRISPPPEVFPPVEEAITAPLPPADTPPIFDGPTLEERSSRASTEPEEPIDPKDLQAAVTQVADIGFVIFGQALGRAEARARQLPGVDPKWVPTKAERAFVSEPAARIAKRHLNAPKEAMDVIDGCLIAVGMGAFAIRGATGIEPLEEASK